MSNIFSILRKLHEEDSGQDLIEYALVAALIALAATAGMTTLANGINDAFSTVSTRLNGYVAAS